MIHFVLFLYFFPYILPFQHFAGKKLQDYTTIRLNIHPLADDRIGNDET